MRLEGSLGAFSLADLLGLLAGTRKSGALRLTGAGVTGSVYLQDGAITGATSDVSVQTLARRLIGSGAIDDDAINRTVTRAGEHPELGFGTVLLAEESVDRDLLAAAATEQAVDAVFDLMGWEQGDFAFEADAVNPDDVGIAHPVPRVLAEADARLAAWATVPEWVTRSDTVPQMPVVLPADPSLTRDEWALLALIDNRRSIGDLVTITGCGRFTVVSTVAALAQRGLLEPHDRRRDHVSAVQRRQALLVSVEGDRREAAAPAAPPSPIESPVEPPVLDQAAERPAQQALPELPPESWAAAPVAPQGDDDQLVDPDDAALNRSMMLRLIAGVRGL